MNCSACHHSYLEHDNHACKRCDCIMNQQAIHEGWTVEQRRKQLKEFEKPGDIVFSGSLEGAAASIAFNAVKEVLKKQEEDED